MADVFLKLVIDDKEYDAKLIKADQQLKKLKDTGGATSKELISHFKNVAAALGLAFSIDQVVNYGKYAIEQFAEQEKANNKLRVALGYTSQALLDQASALQETTAAADENIIAAQSLIAAHIKDENQIKRVTEAALDLSVAKGIDLLTAADMVTKSIVTETNALQRQGIEVEGTKGSVERLNSAVTNITRLYGGQAAAELLTYTGKVEHLKNKISDLSEEVGHVLVDSIYGANAAFNALKFTGDGFYNTLQTIGSNANIFSFLARLTANALLAGHALALTSPWEYTREASLKAFQEISGQSKKFVDDRIKETELQIKAMEKLGTLTKDQENDVEQLKTKLSVYKTTVAGIKDVKQEETTSELELLKLRYNINEITKQQYVETIQARISLLKSGTIEEKKILSDWVDEWKKIFPVKEAVTPKNLPMPGALGLDAVKDSPEKIKQLQQLQIDSMKEGKDKETAIIEQWYAEQKETKLYKGSTDARSAIDAQYYNRKAELAKQTSETELDLIRDVMGQVANAVGENTVLGKAAAVAQATMNTYEAATKALTAGPILGPILAGIITALGMANVAKIMSTETPKVKGYDQGGIIRPGQTGFFEGRRVEIVAPEKNFLDYSAKLIMAAENSSRAGYARSASGNNNGSDMKEFINEIRAWQRNIQFKFKSGEFVTGSRKMNQQYNDLKF